MGSKELQSRHALDPAKISARLFFFFFFRPAVVRPSHRSPGHWGTHLNRPLLCHERRTGQPTFQTLTSGDLRGACCVTAPVGPLGEKKYCRSLRTRADAPGASSPNRGPTRAPRDPSQLITTNWRTPSFPLERGRGRGLHGRYARSPNMVGEKAGHVGASSTSTGSPG